MEAAHIVWRPLGRLLVEQGLLTYDELERALARQQVTGRRLGETIVELGFVSGPDLGSALAAQYGIELTTETGFGTGLRAEIQRRHESDRPRTDPPTLSLVEPRSAEAEENPVVEDPDHATGEALLLTQLEEQWAKLASAEAALAESAAELASLTEVAEERQRTIGRLTADVRGCDAELDRLREENGRLRTQAAWDAPLPAASSEHLLFVQLDGGYELVAGDGPPPQPNALLELPQFGDEDFVVTRVGRSPLPADSRACSFVQRL